MSIEVEGIKLVKMHVYTIFDSSLTVDGCNLHVQFNYKDSR
jgi:hypothetical protein